MDELIQPTDEFYTCTINDLPDEVLEYILSLLPPYKDLEQCMAVCQRWKKNVENVIHYTKTNLLRSLANFDIKWENVTPPEISCSITKRYSHSACCHENSMYVFGGCTCTSTTFNDLWRLDLSTRKWARMLTMGSYPSPKACATLVYHKDTLLLFGGWTHPSPYPLHQAWRTFHELHMYDIITNIWYSITTTNSPPPMAGHSATIHNDNMVVFGGLQGQYGSSNDIWCFNLNNQTWTKQAISGAKPQRRYGQSQIALDDTHLLILGGCGGGPNMVLNDVWLLTMTDPAWTWKRVTIKNPQWAASHIWCHPACKVGEYVVVFSRNPISVGPMFTYSKWRPTGQVRNPSRDVSQFPHNVRRASENVQEPVHIEKDVNVNGRRGSLNLRPQASESSRTSADDQVASTSSTSQNQEDRTVPSTSTLSSPCSSSGSSSYSSPVEDLDALHALNTSQEDSAISKQGEENSSREDTVAQSSRKVLEKDEYSCRSSATNNINSNLVNRPDTRSAQERSSMYKRTLGLPFNKRPEIFSPLSCSNSMAAFREDVPVNPNVVRQRGRQLEALRKIEERLRNGRSVKPPSVPSPSPPSPSQPHPQPVLLKREPSPSSAIKLLTPKMAMFILDISCVLKEECYVSWLPIKSVAEGSPEDMILYTLVPGNGELIMFGGIQKDAMSITEQAQSSVNITNTVSNSLHFITAPRSVI